MERAGMSDMAGVAARERRESGERPNIKARPLLEQLLNQPLRLFRGNSKVAKCERAFARVQYRFQIFQGLQVSPAPEQSNRNFFAPLITALNRFVEIGRVV